MKEQPHPLPVAPIHAPQLTKAAGSHVGLAKLRETLDRDGPQGKANRKTLEGQSSIFCGGHCYPLLLGTYCIPGTVLKVKHQRKAQLYLHCGTEGERLRLRETPAPSLSWQNHPSVHSCKKHL